MSTTKNNETEKLEQGRALARRLYDLKISQLEKIDAQSQTAYLAEFPLLRNVEFEDVRRQVIEAKTNEKIKVGWGSIPHDITVLVFVLATVLVNLRTGVILATATLVLLESICQFYINPLLYPVLSLGVWLTYPAYVLLGWVLYTRGYAWYWVVAAVLGASVGIFLAGAVARIPMMLIMEARVEAAKRKAREGGDKKEPDKPVKVQGKK
jgi:hypothetical protein